MGMAAEGTQSGMNAKLWSSRRFVIAAAAMTILFALLVAASLRLVQIEGELSDDISEDMVWLASQAQYEAMRFADALSNYSGQPNGTTPDELQLRLDLLISRIGIFEEGEPGRQAADLGFR